MPRIRIVARRDGFRRAGISHSAEPQIYPASQFTKEQLAELKAESMLIVDELPDEKPAKTDEKKDDKKDDK